MEPPLPEGLESKGLWVKGDMVNAVGFHRLDLIRTGKIGDKRQYYMKPIDDRKLKLVQKCVLNALGLGGLTSGL